jgi:PAS domain S-box-containing protein
MPESANASEHETLWIDAWRNAVAATPSAVVLADMETTRFLELSPRAAALFGVTPEAGRGRTYLSFAERPDAAAQTFEMARAGQIDSVRSRRNFVRDDGSRFELMSWGWAIRSSTGGVLGLWIADDEPNAAPFDAYELVDDAARAWVGSQLGSGALDERWNIAQLETDAEEILGSRSGVLLGRPLHALVLPADRASLLAALARASSGIPATTNLRLQPREGTCILVRATLSIASLGGERIVSFVLDGVDDGRVGGHRARLTELERTLRRIAAEVHAANVLTSSSPPREVQALPMIAKLSARQWEVLTYLVQGERVSTIAREMYVSPSTVRNHLAAIYQKVGVHSQEELVDLVRRA